MHILNASKWTAPIGHNVVESGRQCCSQIGLLDRVIQRVKNKDFSINRIPLNNVGLEISLRCFYHCWCLKYFPLAITHKWWVWQRYWVGAVFQSVPAVLVMIQFTELMIKSWPYYISKFNSVYRTSDKIQFTELMIKS